MGTHYTYATPMSCDVAGANPDADEINVSVSYSVAWGTPETGRGYMADPYKYDPGSGDEIEDLRLLSINGERGPFDQEAEAMILQEIAQNHGESMIEEVRLVESAWAPE